MTHQFGRYEVMGRIGRGGMAEVFRARFAPAPGVTKDVALKRILPAYAEQPEFREMFLAEARLTMRLSHGNVVQVFDAGEVDGALFLAMEWIDGVALDEVLLRATSRGLRGLPPVVAALIVVEVLKGLHHAHTRKDDQGRPLQLVHRDISPDNVLVSYDGEVKVTDFGIAKARMAGRHLTRPGIFKGKFAYGAPEQARAEAVDARADIYATGIVLYELIAGKNPSGSTEVAKEVGAGARALPRFPVELADPEFVNLISRALAPEKENRYHSAQAFQQALMQWAASRGGEHVAAGVAHTMRWLFAEELQERQPGVPLGAEASTFLELVSTGMMMRPNLELPGRPRRAPPPPEEPEARPASLPPAPAPADESFTMRQVTAIGVAVSVLLAGVGVWLWLSEETAPAPEVSSAAALQRAMRAPQRPVPVAALDQGLPGPAALDAGAVALEPSVFEVRSVPASFKLTDAHLLFLDGAHFIEWSPGTHIEVVGQPILQDRGFLSGAVPVFAYQREAGQGEVTRLTPGKAETLRAQPGSVQLFVPSYDVGLVTARFVPGKLSVSGRVGPMPKTALQWVRPERRVTVLGLSSRKTYLLTLAPAKAGGKGMPVLVAARGDGRGRPAVGPFERVGVLSTGEHKVTNATSLALVIPTLSGVAQEQVQVTLAAVDEPAPSGKVARPLAPQQPVDMPSVVAQNDEARPYFEKAAGAMAQGQLASAREAIVKGLKLEPRNANARYLAGVLAQRQADPKEAQFQFQLFLKLAPPEHPNRPEVAAIVERLQRER